MTCKHKSTWPDLLWPNYQPKTVSHPERRSSHCSEGWHGKATSPRKWSSCQNSSRKSHTETGPWTQQAGATTKIGWLKKNRNLSVVFEACLILLCFFPPAFLFWDWNFRKEHLNLQHEIPSQCLTDQESHIYSSWSYLVTSHVSSCLRISSCMSSLLALLNSLGRYPNILKLVKWRPKKGNCMQLYVM